MEDDVVVKQEVVFGTCNSRVPLAGQVGIFGIPFFVVGEEVVELLGIRPGVDDFLGIDACQRVAGDVARVVEARLNRAQSGFFEAFEDLWKIIEQHAAQLQVLAGGDVAAAVFAVALNNGTHNAQLLGAENAVGDAQAQHELAGCLGAPEHPVPLQAQLQIRFVDLLPAHLGKLIDLAADKQAILVGLVLLNFVELFAF